MKNLQFIFISLLIVSCKNASEEKNTLENNPMGYSDEVLEKAKTIRQKMVF